MGSETPRQSLRTMLSGPQDWSFGGGAKTSCVRSATPRRQSAKPQWDVLSDLTSDVGIAVSSSEVGFQVAKRVLDAFDFAVALERMDERAARKLSDLLGTTVSFPHHRARAGASGGFNRRAAAVPTSIRDRILREHDVDVRLHAWLAARDP